MFGINMLLHVYSITTTTTTTTTNNSHNALYMVYLATFVTHTHSFVSDVVLSTTRRDIVVSIKYLFVICVHL